MNKPVENEVARVSLEVVDAIKESKQKVFSSTINIAQDVRWFLRAVWVAAYRFYWDNGFSKASSLAYTSLLSLVPLTALCFGLLSSFTASQEFVRRVREFLFKQLVPDDKTVATVLVYLQDFSSIVASFNVVAIFALVLTSLLLLNSIESTLNETWQVYTPRPYMQRIGIYSAIILISPIMLVSSYYFAVSKVEPLLITSGWGGALLTFYAGILPFIFDLGVFVLLYFLVPKAPVKFLSALLGGLVAALFFGLAKFGFAYYLAEFSTYDKIYSTIAAIPISLVWLYFAWSVVLFGAEVSYQAQYLPRVGKHFKTTVMGVGDGRLVLAIQALVFIATAFRNGGRLPSDLELCETLGCSSVVLKPALDSLEESGILGRTDNREMQVTLLRDPDQIKIQEVRAALFGGVQEVRFAWALEKLFSSIKNKEPSDLSLGDILSVNSVTEAP
jgi:membrane protein